MMQRNNPDDEHFRKAREAFDDMNLQGQASFLLEATARTVAHGAETLGRTVGREIDRMFDRNASTRQERRRGPGPAEPETAQQRSQHGASEDDL